MAIRGLAYQTGRGSVPTFRLGLTQTGATYDGFRGTPEAV